MKTTIFFLTLAMSIFISCEKEEPTEPTNPDNPTPTTQTKNLPVYLGDVALNSYFGGTPPMVKITESGTASENVLSVNTCANSTGSSFTIAFGKSYTVVFGTYIDSTWAQYGGFSGTMTVAADGQISGTIGSGMEQLLAIKASNYGACGTAISGDILLFY